MGARPMKQENVDEFWLEYSSLKAHKEDSSRIRSRLVEAVSRGLIDMRLYLDLIGSGVSPLDAGEKPSKKLPANDLRWALHSHDGHGNWFRVAYDGTVESSGDLDKASESFLAQVGAWIPKETEGAHDE